MKKLKSYIIKEVKGNKIKKSITAVFLGQNEGEYRKCVGGEGDYVFRDDNVIDEEGDQCSEFFYITQKEIRKGKVLICLAQLD